LSVREKEIRRLLQARQAESPLLGLFPRLSTCLCPRSVLFFSSFRPAPSTPPNAHLPNESGPSRLHQSPHPVCVETSIEDVTFAEKAAPLPPPVISALPIKRISSTCSADGNFTADQSRPGECRKPRHPPSHGAALINSEGSDSDRAFRDLLEGLRKHGTADAITVHGVKLSAMNAKVEIEAHLKLLCLILQ
jgi:hypothetical protein